MYLSQNLTHIAKYLDLPELVKAASCLGAYNYVLLQGTSLKHIFKREQYCYINIYYKYWSMTSVIKAWELEVFCHYRAVSLLIRIIDTLMHVGKQLLAIIILCHAMLCNNDDVHFKWDTFYKCWDKTICEFAMEQCVILQLLFQEIWPAQTVCRFDSLSHNPNFIFWQILLIVWLDLCCMKVRRGLYHLIYIIGLDFILFFSLYGW